MYIVPYDVYAVTLMGYYIIMVSHDILDLMWELFAYTQCLNNECVSQCGSLCLAFLSYYNYVCEVKRYYIHISTIEITCE